MDTDRVTIKTAKSVFLALIVIQDEAIMPVSASRAAIRERFSLSEAQLKFVEKTAIERNWVEKYDADLEQEAKEMGDVE